VLCDVDCFRIFKPDVLNVDQQVVNSTFKLSRMSMLWMDKMSNLLMKRVSSSRKCFSSSLPVMREHYLVRICSSMIGMSMEIGHGQKRASNSDRCDDC